MLAAPVAPAWFHGIHYSLVVLVPLAAVFCVFAFTPSDPVTDVPQRTALRDARLRQSVGVATAADLSRIGARVVAPAEQPVDAPPLALAAISAGAGLIHAAVSAAHFSEYWLYGTFFVLAAAGQLVWAYRMARAPSRHLLLVGIAGNATVILLWLASRTTGLPVGPAPGSPESVGWRDAVATVYEVAFVVSGWMLLDDRWPFPRAISRRTTAITVSAVVGIAAAAAAIAGH